MWPMYPDGFGWGWGWMIIGVVFFILFWGAIIALIVWVVRRVTERPAPPLGRTALDIAKERYARGEISREEFERLKQDLS